MISKLGAEQESSIPWALIENITGQELSNWDLGDAQVVIIKIPEREIHPSVAALAPVILDGFDVRGMSKADIRHLVTLRAAYELDHGRYVYEALSGQGAVGCALSHYRVWQALAERPDDGPGIIVLEDDAKLLAPYTNLDSLLALVQPDDEFLLLSSNTVWPVLGIVAGTRRRWAGDKVNGTRGYFLRPSLARSLLDGAWPINVQVDYYFRNFAHAHSDRKMHTIGGVIGMSTTQSCLAHSNVRCLPRFRWPFIGALSAMAILLLAVVVLAAMLWQNQSV